MGISRQSINGARNFTLIGSLLVVAFPSLATAQPTITNLGILPGMVNSRATGLSEDGSVVVGICFAASGSRAFRWTSQGGMQNLGVLPGSTESEAFDVSADGSVVVGKSPVANGGAFLWTNTGGMVSLGVLPGNTASMAAAVSADGLAVAGSSFGVAPTRAFVWTKSGGMKDLGLLPTATDAYAQGISGDGSVVVGTCVTPAGDRAFRWTQATGMQPIAMLPGSVYSSAAGVSADGLTVAGEWSAPGGDLDWYRWTSTGGTLDVGGISEWMLLAQDLSDDGSVIVGQAYHLELGVASMLWSESSGLAYGDQYFTNHGVDLQKWQIMSVSAVSKDGAAMAGQGQYEFSVNRAYLVTGLPATPAACIADCDASGILDIEDFICFQTVYAVGDPAADCDGSGLLDIDDFICFQTLYALGC